MNKVTKISAVFILVAAFSSVSALLARAGEDLCWDCLVSTWPEDPERPWKAVEGDIVDCFPCGHAFGDRDLLHHKVVRISATRAERDALLAPVTDEEGALVRKKRFTASEVDGRVVIGDRATSLAVTPTEAKAAVAADLEAKSAPALEEIK
ncbi:MAG: hypothetical protein HZB23_03520 [Deltaproteobacteria bacterium]|nr:hypothetical protein [Deltaproteobacteria bacterium]